VEHLEHDWDRQREQLSALLDNELDEQERAELLAHLPTCAECRAELESLRRTRALIRALPQPALPRSFALPVEAAPVSEVPRATAVLARPVPASRPTSGPPTSRAGRSRSPVRTLQWLSSIAAVLGIVVLFSGFFSSHTFSAATTSTAAFGNNQGQTAGAQVPTGTSPSTPARTPNGTRPGVGTPAPTERVPAATPTASGEKTPGSSPAPGDPLGPFISVTGLGILLLLLSACGFAISWGLRRRY
jgi:negative regulator of sigma E activity